MADTIAHRDLRILWRQAFQYGPSRDAPGTDLPFADLLAPYVGDAERRLRARAGAGYRLLGRRARTQLVRPLCVLLSDLASPALQAEFARFRRNHPGSRAYRAFVAAKRGAGLADLLDADRPLSRVLAMVARQWVDANEVFLRRLRADRRALERAFRAPGPLNRVTGLHPDLSDRHDGGKTVIRVRFASGLQVMYKPRDLGLEAGYDRLWHWLHAQAATSMPDEKNRPLRCRTARVLCRRGYGWQEYVRPRACAGASAAERFYRRAGMVLCVLHACGAGDAHGDNLVAAGEHPVLVDAETLLPPVGWSAGPSVLHTGLLPDPRFSPIGRPYDMSGLGEPGSRRTHLRIPRWDDVNTSRMRVRFVSAWTVPRPNLPRDSRGRAIPLNDPEVLIGGFRAMYRLLLQQRARLLAPAGPLAALLRRHVRAVRRDTTEYLLILNGSGDPSRSTVDLRADERAALRRLDVPRFVARPGAAALRNRIRRLSRADCERQIRAIRVSSSLRLLDLCTGVHLE